MQHNLKMYLLEISGSIDSIYEYIGEKRDFNFYESNKLVRRGVERELEIIGEAVNRALKLDPNVGFSDARRIVDLRN